MSLPSIAALALSHAALGYASGAIFFLAVIPYVVDILKGNTKPNRSAYAIWSVVNIVLVLSYIESGASTTIWYGVCAAMSALLILGLSIKRGMGGFSKLDISCFFIAMMAVVLWVWTKNPAVALYSSVLAYGLGHLPVLKKAYLAPKTENALSWALNWVASVLNIFALTSFSMSGAFFPIVATVLDTAIAALLIMRPVMRLLSSTEGALTACAEARRPLNARLATRLERDPE